MKVVHDLGHCWIAKSQYELIITTSCKTLEKGLYSFESEFEEKCGIKGSPIFYCKKFKEYTLLTSISTYFDHFDYKLLNVGLVPLEHYGELSAAA